MAEQSNNTLNKEAAKPQRTITAEISVEVIGDDNTDAKITPKRRDFIKERNKKIYLRGAILYFAVAMFAFFFDNIIVGCVFFTFFAGLAAIMWAEYDWLNTPPGSGYMPWWYGAL